MFSTAKSEYLPGTRNNRFPSDYRSLLCKRYSLSARLLLAILAIFISWGSNGSALAQSASTSSFCSRDNSLEIIQQQIDATKTFDDAVQRITILIRAADVLWPYKQQRARSTFIEASDLAVQNFKEKGDKPRTEGRAMLVEIPDQRYVVIRAVSRHDAAWAKRLTDEMLKDSQEVTKAGPRDSEANVRTAWKLLDTASSFLPAEIPSAMSFATASLNYPASIRLTAFLYKFAEVDQKSADRFYEQALAVYGDKPMREFLYLAAYPFGGDTAGDMPWFGSYTVPGSFHPNVGLQRSFLSLLLRRAQQALQIPLDEGDNYNEFPGTGHILQVLTRVEPEVQKTLPDLSAAVEQARNDLLGTLSAERQSIFFQPKPTRDSAPKKTFDEQVEAAEKEPNVNKRDELIATAILNAMQKENLDHIVDTVDKISDSNLRAQLLDWFYFSYTQQAVKEKRIDDARRLASKVEQMDQRAFLYSEIATEALKTMENLSQAASLIDEIVTTAQKGPNTIVTSRALLSAAYLYLRIDPNRAISVLGDAVKSVNRLEAPDFSKQSLVRKIEGRNFARYALFKTPGFDPENAFREMGKIAFDDALSQASGFTDKSLRALITLALADVCLQKVQQQEKADKAKKPKS
jgi:hypothetical protein